MNLYKHILMAIDTITHSEETMDVTREFATSEGARVSLLYTLPHLEAKGMDYLLPSLNEIESRIIETAKSRLSAAANEHELGDADESVLFGNSHDIILEAALSKNVDLIVVNNDHQQATLISDAPCDILAVRCQ
ncbi:MAG: universal stress protein [Gammaproteobacteria bacterium]|nr:universal stress protein [Gammaproteobacteria bacterium]